MGVKGAKGSKGEQRGVKGSEGISTLGFRVLTTCDNFLDCVGSPPPPRTKGSEGSKEE